ncbi:MAG: sugar phosphate nucleotidyltransferase [Plesiomonas sp.]
MNAIILAAGMGTRLRPLTENKPKPLVEINGTPIIESQLSQLTQLGIDDITIVTGYQAEKFHYLKDKYPVSFVFNDKYETYNNWYSLFLVRDKLGDTFIMDGDVFINKNIFIKNPAVSTYYCKLSNDFNNEWTVLFNETNKITNITIDSCTPQESSKYFFSAISFWKEKESSIIKDNLISLYRTRDENKTLFWDNLIIDKLSELDLYAHIVNDDELYEIDSINDMNKFKLLLR